MEERFFQLVERGEPALIERFEAAGLGRKCVERPSYFPLILDRRRRYAIRLDITQIYVRMRSSDSGTLCLAATKWPVQYKH